MALDPSIITGIRPVQIDSPVNALAQVLKVQSMRQDAQLGQAKLDEYQRTKTRQNKLLELVQGLPANTTDDQRISALKGGGYFDEADKLETGMLNRQKTGAEVKAKEWEAQSKKLDLAGQAFGAVRQNPTLENANQVLDYLGQNGVYSPETVAQYKAAVAADPTKIASLADTAFRTVLGAKEQLMKVDTRNLGGMTQTVGTDPLTGKTTVLNSAANTVSPDAQLSASTARRGQDVSAATTRRGQDMTDARSREQIEQGRTQIVQSDTGPLLVNMRAGTGTPVTVGGKAVPAKGSGQALKDAQSVLGLLDLAEPLLETATSSLVGAGVDRAAAVFGKSTEGAKAAAQLKALEGALIAKQPKMSGPQSDKDVLLYRQMAGQIGDASVPIETRRAALMTVRALNEKYAGQSMANAPATPTKPAALPAKNAKGWTLMTDAQGNRAYVSPDKTQHEDAP